MDAKIEQETIKGGAFILKATPAHQLFCPEDFSEEQLLLISTVKDFINSKVAPHFDTLEKLDLPLTKQLIENCGELGLLGATFPEAYGGSEMDFLSSMILSEQFAAARSFSLSFGAHTGIGMLPLLYFGNEDQKSKYLPRLVAGTLKSAYCLTEPGSGSDALAAKSTAVLSDDGTYYLLNGQKMWITNGGFADIFTVFAKINGQHFTAFIVERSWDGVSLGAEEDKMGIKGSSTCQVFFENVKVPIENVLGEPGKGHKIAFNILNIGRIKLAASAFGGAKKICTAATRYANERQQFGQSIGQFGAIQHKLAEMAIRTFASESASYRAADAIRQQEMVLKAEGLSEGQAHLGAAEEFAIECALLKVQATETLDYVADEGVQIYGGMGYSEEAPMAAAYRDARINRIFEGTNEINRLLAMDMLLKRAMSGQLDWKNTLANKRNNADQTTNGAGEDSAILLATELAEVAQWKRCFLSLLMATLEHFGKKMQYEQEILMQFSDMLAEIYLTESILLRCQKTSHIKSAEDSAILIDMAQVFVTEAVERLRLNAKRVVQNWAQKAQKDQLLASIEQFTYHQAINTKAARRRIASRMLDANAYCF